MVLALVEINYSALPAVGIIIIMMPLQVYLARIKSRIGFENTNVTSKRVHIMSEILTAIKLIKFYAWEQPFDERIQEIRRTELNLLKKNLYANAINFCIVFCVPVIVALLSLLLYWKTGNAIGPVIGFTIVSVFNTLRYPLFMLPLAINSMSGTQLMPILASPRLVQLIEFHFKDARTALKRLDEFFSHEEIEPCVRLPSPTHTDETICVVSVLWGDFWFRLPRVFRALYILTEECGVHMELQDRSRRPIPKRHQFQRVSRKDLGHCGRRRGGQIVAACCSFASNAAVARRM